MTSRSHIPSALPSNYLPRRSSTEIVRAAIIRYTDEGNAQGQIARNMDVAANWISMVKEGKTTLPIFRVWDFAAAVEMSNEERTELLDTLFREAHGNKPVFDYAHALLWAFDQTGPRPALMRLCAMWNSHINGYDLDDLLNDPINQTRLKACFYEITKRSMEQDRRRIEDDHATSKFVALPPTPTGAPKRP